MIAFAMLLSGAWVKLNGELTAVETLGDGAVLTERWVPLPGTRLEENLEATQLRTGAVLLQWWVSAPGRVEAVVSRRELGAERGGWQELGRGPFERFVDRDVLSGKHYEYEVKVNGNSADGGGQSARTEVTIGGFRLDVVSDEDAVDGSGGVVTEWTDSFPDMRTLTLGPNPRLYINAEGIERYQAWAKEDRQMAVALRELEAEAKEAYEAMVKRKTEIPRARETNTHQQNFLMIRQMALGWAFTGREEWRRCAVESLLEYADFYKDVPIGRKNVEGHLTGQTLNEAMIMITLAWAYDLVYSSLDDETRQRIEQGIFIPAYELLDVSDRAASNWQSYHNAAMVAIGLALGNLDYVQRAVHGKSGVIWQMHHTLGQDGIYYAQSIAYHYFAMAAFTSTAAILYENGADLFAYRDGGRNLRNMYDVPFYHAMSDGNQAPFGNSQIDYNIRAQWIAWNYAYAYRHYRAPAYLWQWEVSKGAARRHDLRMPPLISLGQIKEALLENAEVGIPSVAEPMEIGTGPALSPAIRSVVGSSILEDVGMVVLRGESGSTSGESAMIWKPHGKTAGHQHPNSLGIYWQSPQHRWMSGSGKWAPYGDVVHRDWVTKTLSDNTLVVDRKSHAPATRSRETWVTDEDGKSSHGVLLGFTAGPDFGYVAGYNNRVYDHAYISRRHINAGVYALDLVRGESTRDALFENVLHLWGELVESNLELVEDSSMLSKDSGYPYLSERRYAASSETWETRWQAPEVDEQLYLTVLGAPDSTYHVARTPWGKDRTRSTLLTSREGMEASFVSVWRYGAGKDPVLSIEGVGDQVPSALAGALCVGLVDGSEDFFVWGPSMSEGEWGGVGFRGRDLMMRWDTSGALFGATLVEGDRLNIGQDLEISLSMPSTWSWRALESGGFILVYDDDYPVILKLRGAQSYRAVLLDRWGNPENELKANEDQTWQLPARRNIVFLPVGVSEVELPSLVKTVELGKGSD